jgi:hypothetical protein
MVVRSVGTVFLVAQRKRLHTSRMNLSTPLAIIIGAINIALSGLFLFRYEFAPGSTQAYAVRLNKLTGRIAYCRLTGERASEYKYRCQ